MAYSSLLFSSSYSFAVNVCERLVFVDPLCTSGAMVCERFQGKKKKKRTKPNRASFPFEGS
jgi:hypothetical protein